MRNEMPEKRTGPERGLCVKPKMGKYFPAQNQPTLRPFE